MSYQILKLVKDANDIVKKVQFNKTLETETVTCILDLAPPPVEPVPYADLTELVVMEWLDNHTEMPSIDDVLQRKLEAKALQEDTQFPWSVE